MPLIQRKRVNPHPNPYKKTWIFPFLIFFVVCGWKLTTISFVVGLKKGGPRQRKITWLLVGCYARQPDAVAGGGGADPKNQ